MRTDTCLREVENREELEKEDIWIEVPLIISEKAVGKICLSMPEGISPTDWGLLHLAAIGAAAAIASARTSEEMAERERKLVSQVWREFISQASHRLRTPICIMNGTYAEMDRSEKKGTLDLDHARELFREFQDNITSLAVLVKRLEDYAKSTGIEATSLRPEKTNLPELVKDCLKTALRSEARTAVTVDSQLADPSVVVDREILREVVSELAVNARKHAGLGLTISVSIKKADSALAEKRNLAAESDYVCIELRDNGPGVLGELKEKSFEPLFTTNRKQGTGMGLAILRRLIGLLGGAIHETGEHGKGCCFELIIPKRKD